MQILHAIWHIFYHLIRSNIKGAGILVYRVFALQSSITEALPYICSHYVKTDTWNYTIQFVTKFTTHAVDV